MSFDALLLPLTAGRCARALLALSATLVAIDVFRVVQIVTTDAMGLSMVNAREGESAQSVLGRRHGFKMVGTDAQPVPTQVVHHESLGYGSDEVSVTPTMSKEIGAVSVIEDAVPFVTLAPRPLPAPTVGIRDSSEKSLLDTPVSRCLSAHRIAMTEPARVVRRAPASVLRFASTSFNRAYFFHLPSIVCKAGV